jgi:hypothetical protein
MNTEKNTLKGHLFTVDILIESSSNPLAMEKLIHLLNSPEVKDYQIKKGVELGKIIEATLQESAKEATSETKKETAKKSAETAAGAGKPDPRTDGKTDPEPQGKQDQPQIVEAIERFKNNNTLIRLMVVKGKGIKLSIPCRILNYDPVMQNVSIYHVDEKKVYLFRLNEIDDFVVS